MKIADDQLIKTNTIILGVFFCFLLAQLLYWLPGDVLDDGITLWVITDWLIDYSSGFARRGLSGELLNAASPFVPPRATVGVLSWLVYGAVVFGYVRLCLRSLERLNPIMLAAMLFLPSLLPFYLYDHSAFGRKETIGFLILLWHLWSLESHGDAQPSAGSRGSFFRDYLKKLLFLSVILLPIHVFIHESTLLLFLPVHAMITYSIIRLDPSRNVAQRFFYPALICLPALLASSIVVIFGQVDFDAARAICEKWELATVLDAGSCDPTGSDRMWALPGSLTALPWTLSDALALTRELETQEILAWILDFTILGFATVYVVTQVSRSLVDVSSGSFGKTETTSARRHSRIMSYKYFLLPMLISIPLYLLGGDFGRWFSVCCINYAMICLSSEVHSMEFRIASSGKAGRTPFLGPPPQQGSPRGYASVTTIYTSELFSLLLIALLIRMPHCCIDWIKLFAWPIEPLARNLIAVP